MSIELREIGDVTNAAWKRVPNSRGGKMEKADIVVIARYGG